MKKLLCTLLMLSATAWADTCVVPGAHGNTPVFDPTTNAKLSTDVVTPIIPGQQVESWGAGGPGSCTSVTSAAAACNAVCVGKAGSGISDITGVNVQCTCYDGSGNPSGGNVLQYGLCGSANVCPSGFTLQGDGKCHLDAATNNDTVMSGQGVTVNRGSNGMVTSFVAPGVGTDSVSLTDTLGRPTQVSDSVNGTISYTYYGNTSKVQTRTDYTGMYTYTYDHGNIGSVTLPDGSMYTFQHSLDANNVYHLTGVGVVNGVIGGSRAGTLAPWGVSIPYVTSALELPSTKQLAFMMEGLEVPGFHAVPVNTYVPFASVNYLGYFEVGYNDTYQHASADPVAPLFNDTLLPVDPPTCVAADFSRPISPYCKQLLVSLHKSICGGGPCTEEQAIKVRDMMIDAGCGYNGHM